MELPSSSGRKGENLKRHVTEYKTKNVITLSKKTFRKCLLSPSFSSGHLGKTVNSLNWSCLKNLRPLTGNTIPLAHGSLFSESGPRAISSSPTSITAKIKIKSFKMQQRSRNSNWVYGFSVVWYSGTNTTFPSGSTCTHRWEDGAHYLRWTR